MKQDGQAVFKFAPCAIPRVVPRDSRSQRRPPDEIDLLVSHQANRRIILSAAGKLGVPEEKVVINIETVWQHNGGHDSIGPE